MIILDTNVLSELMLYAPNPQVTDWVNGLPDESVWTTAVTLYELRFGLMSMPRSRKRRFREDVLFSMLEERLENRIIDFDGKAAEHAAAISSALRERGRAVDIRDHMIAGIVASKRAMLATRNTKHFDGTGIQLIDPWRSG